jgi:hypothetical protein
MSATQVLPSPAAVRTLLVREINAAHVSLQRREQAREALLITPDMRAGGITAAVRALPAIDVTVGNLEHHSNVAQDGRVRRNAIQQPVGQGAVVERLAELLRPLLQCGEGCRGLAQDCPGVGPLGGVVTSHPLLACVVFVWVMPGEQEGDFDALARRDGNRG